MTAVLPQSRTADGRSRRRSLTSSIAALRGRRVNVSLEGLFLTVGALCLPIGVIVIVLGWYGAAHTGHLYEQNDYLISGGLLGLGLIFIGGFLYFGYWMTRQIRATESGSQQTLRALARLEEKMGASAGGAVAVGATGVFVATEHGSMLHRPNCPAVAGKSVRILDQADTATYRPCSICMPAD
jgi:hypothetical protein